MGRRIEVEVDSALIIDPDSYQQGFEAGRASTELSFTLPDGCERFNYYKGLLEGYVDSKLRLGANPYELGIEICDSFYKCIFPINSQLSIREILSFDLPDGVKEGIADYVKQLMR